MCGGVGICARVLANTEITKKSGFAEGEKMGFSDYNIL